jgi:hypothetical protein
MKFQKKEITDTFGEFHSDINDDYRGVCDIIFVLLFFPLFINRSATVFQQLQN